MRLPFLVPGQNLQHALCSQPGLPVSNTHIQRAWHGGQSALPALLGEPDLLSALSASVDILDVLSCHFFCVSAVRDRGCGKIIRGILGVTGAVFTGKERGRSVCAVWAILFCGLARNALPKLAVGRVSFLCILSCPGKIVFQGTFCNREPCHGNNPGQIGTGTLAAIQHFIKPVLQKMHDIVHGEPFLSMSILASFRTLIRRRTSLPEYLFLFAGEAFAFAASSGWTASWLYAPCPARKTSSGVPLAPPSKRAELPEFAQICHY